MRVGDRVRLRSENLCGTVVRIDNDRIIVDIDGETRRWLARHCVNLSRVQGPRGGLSISERQRAAVRMLHEGRSCREVAEHFGVRPHTVQSWRTRARMAAEDERNLGRR